MSDFEGSVILEAVSKIGKIDDFYEAIDSDDFKKIRNILSQADVEDKEIQWVIKKIRDGDLD